MKISILIPAALFRVIAASGCIKCGTYAIARMPWYTVLLRTFT